MTGARTPSVAQERRLGGAWRGPGGCGPYYTAQSNMAEPRYVGPSNLRYATPAQVLDKRHVTHYASTVIKTFADKRTAELFVRGTVRGFPPDVARRAVRKLEYVDLAIRLDDLKTPPGNRLHALRGDRQGQHAIAINDQWRVCFRFVDGDAYDVQVCDYH